MISFVIGAIGVLLLCIEAYRFFSSSSHDPYRAKASLIVGGVVIVITSAITAPMISVWVKGLEGEAELAQADWNRQIRVREAEAARDSAKLLAEAEVERAKGIAQANEIVANGLGGPEGYLRYLYIQAIEKASEKGSSQFVYLPTEAGLPVLEATRAAKQ